MSADRRGLRATRRMIPSLIGALVISAFLMPAAAQRAAKIPRIGILHPNDIAASSSTHPFFQRLRELGYVEGRNLTILRRSARGQQHRLPAFADELLRAKVDIIVGPASGVWAAVERTRTIPIVVAVGSNLVARGWARSLRRPGGNITGVSTMAPDLAGKQLQLLKEAVPDLSRVAVVAVADNPTHAEEVKHAMQAAPALGLDLVTVPIKGPAGLDGAFRRIRNEKAGGIVVLRHAILLGMRKQMAARARQARLPTVFGHRREAAAGGLMAYGADTKALWRNAADYVDKILKGANPAELPISRSTKFNLTVNLKTARALGIAFPRSILLRADRVIE